VCGGGSAGFVEGDLDEFAVRGLLCHHHTAVTIDDHGWWWMVAKQFGQDGSTKVTAPARLFGRQQATRCSPGGVRSGVAFVV
jgi:hypothetical protein